MNTAETTARFVLVTGATGQQGGAVARALLARGHRVRGVTRDADSAAARRLAALGAELAVGDFTRPETLMRAAEGVDALFAMGLPNQEHPEVETKHGLLLLETAREAGVGHLVYSSVAGADAQTGIPHFDTKYAVEQAITASDVPYTILAPVFFMNNFLFPTTLSDLAEGKLSMALPATRPLQQIAVADIGAFAAALFERRSTVFGHRFEIAGDELTGEEAATVLADVLERPIRYEGYAPDVWRAYSEDMARMFEWFDAVGYSVDIEALHRAFPEVHWHRFEAWAREQPWPSNQVESVHHD